MKKNTITKYLLAGFLCLCMIAPLTACSTADATDTAGESVSHYEETQTVTDTIEWAEEVSETTEESETTPVEETSPEKPAVEMVDFETWAAQEGNDEVCLVVWNEELGVQEILPTVSVSEKVYEVQDGDRLAIPYNESILKMGFRDKHSWMWYDYSYYELTLPSGDISVIDIVYENEETGKAGVLTYSLKTKEVEMDDFETWATQPGNDDAFLVVWNEQLGVQDVLLPYEETQTAYKIKEGDRFAIPAKPHIIPLQSSGANTTSIIGGSSAKYSEIQVSAGDTVTITYFNDAYEKTTINFIFE